MVRADRTQREREARGGGRVCYALAVVSIAVAGGLAAQELSNARAHAWTGQARTVASPGSFVFDADTPGTWSLLTRDAAAGDLERLRVQVRDLDTGAVVTTLPSRVASALPEADPSLTGAFDVAVTTPGRYELMLHGVSGVELLLVEDVLGHARAARRGVRRAAGVVALGTAAALTLLMLGVVVGRSRPRRRATAARRETMPPPLPRPTPRTRVPTGRGLQVTPAAPGAPLPAARPTQSGLYRPLPPQRRRSVFEEETEALDAVFMSDIWEVPTAA